MPCRPANAAFNQIMESRITPRVLIVTPSGVEHATFIMAAKPGPRLTLAAFDAVGKHRPVSLVMLVMHISLVETLESVVTPHEGLVGIGDCFPHAPSRGF